MHATSQPAWSLRTVGAPEGARAVRLSRCGRRARRRVRRHRESSNLAAICFCFCGLTGIQVAKRQFGGASVRARQRDSVAVVCGTPSPSARFRNAISASGSSTSNSLPRPSSRPELLDQLLEPVAEARSSNEVEDCLPLTDKAPAHRCYHPCVCRYGAMPWRKLNQQMLMGC